ncbi:MAG: PLP-dependent aminotransferase family protein [bacterium]|nr:PLP-dependent aminotransferase family protein [bacterium]
MLLNLDDKSPKPKYRQIIEQIRQKIETRVLLPGEKLPSTRRLADNLRIHRSTVAIAYQELWALGFIDLRPGSCPRVRSRVRIATAVNHTEEGVIDWNTTASDPGNAIWQAHRDSRGLVPETEPDTGSSAINFRSLDMDSRLFPLENFRTCLNRVLKDQGTFLLGYGGGAAGFPPLRRYIARHLQSHGISASFDEILITNGSQQGIDLVFRMIASPGKAVAIESPTYDYMLPLLHFSQLEPLEIPLRHDGMDLSVLEEVLKKENPALIYTMPNLQNPTGVSTGQAHREKLLSLCETHRIPILEDSFEEEMKYFGKVVLPIKSMDRYHLVIYCGTFSKVLFPGVRIGWIAAHKECIERLTAIRRFSEISSSMILQAAMYEFCRNGFYDRHISKMHRRFRKRMQTAVRALQRYIPPQWAQWDQPGGGYLVWLKLKPASAPDFDWESLFASYDVQVTPGRYFFFSQNPDTYLRLSISTLNEEEIEEGVQRLAKALCQVYGNNTRR